MKDKWEDCSICICLKCYEEFKLGSDICEHSDCKWCKEENEQWTERCNKYLEKGGTYGEKPE